MSIIDFVLSICPENIDRLTYVLYNQLNNGFIENINKKLVEDYLLKILFSRKKYRYIIINFNDKMIEIIIGDNDFCVLQLKNFVFNSLKFYSLKWCLFIDCCKINFLSIKKNIDVENSCFKNTDKLYEKNRLNHYIINSKIKYIRNINESFIDRL